MWNSCFNGRGFGSGRMMNNWFMPGFFWTIIAIVLVALVVYFVFRRPAKVAVNQSSALNILEERYAKGEIDEDEFTKRKDTLTK